MREIEMRELIEAELDGVAGGMINQDPDGKHPSSPNGGGGGEPIDSRWSQCSPSALMRQSEGLHERRISGSS